MISKADFIRVETPKEILEEAREMHRTMGNFSSSVTKNKRRVAAFAAEIMVTEALGVPLIGDYNYDFVYKDFTVDMKTVQRSYYPGVYPELYYEVNVDKGAAERQTCDYYLFADTPLDASVITYTGFMWKDEFLDSAVLHKAGEDRNAKGKNLHWLEDAYSVKIEKLKPYTKDLAESLRVRYNVID